MYDCFISFSPTAQPCLLKDRKWNVIVKKNCGWHTCMIIWANSRWLASFQGSPTWERVLPMTGQGLGMRSLLQTISSWAVGDINPYPVSPSPCRNTTCRQIWSRFKVQRSETSVVMEILITCLMLWSKGDYLQTDKSYAHKPGRFSYSLTRQTYLRYKVFPFMQKWVRFSLVPRLSGPRLFNFPTGRGAEEGLGTRLGQVCCLCMEEIQIEHPALCMHLLPGGCGHLERNLGVVRLHWILQRLTETI